MDQISELQKVTKKNPKDFNSFIKLSKAYLDDGREEDSIDAYKKAYKASKYSENVAQKYALFLMKRRRWKDAKKVIDKIVKEGPTVSSLFHCQKELAVTPKDTPESHQVTIDKSTLWDIGNILRRRPMSLLNMPEVRARLGRQRRHKFVEQGKLNTVEESGDVIKNAVVHNVDMLEMSNDDGGRPALLVKPLVSIDWVNIHKKEMDVLTIGPRSETEIFCLWAEGFSPDRVKGLDLISYSPLIGAGDAHKIEYPDNSFDAIVAGWILAYSNNPQQIADEIMRVARPNAYIAVGCAFSPESRRKNHAENLDYIKSKVGKDIAPTLFTEVEDITQYFKPRMKKLLFQGPVERERREGSAAVSCVIQLD